MTSEMYLQKKSKGKEMSGNGTIRTKRNLNCMSVPFGQVFLFHSYLYIYISDAKS